MRDAAVEYRIVLSALSESQYATRTRSYGSPAFVANNDVFERYANKWLGYADTAKSLYGDLMPDLGGGFADYLTGGIYGEIDNFNTFSEAASVMGSMINDLNTLETELYSNSKNPPTGTGIEKTYSRLDKGYSMLFLESASDAALFSKLAGKYSGLSDTELHEFISYFENVADKGIISGSEYLTSSASLEGFGATYSAVKNAGITGVPSDIHLIQSFSLSSNRPTAIRFSGPSYVVDVNDNYRTRNLAGEQEITLNILHGGAGSKIIWKILSIDKENLPDAEYDPILSGGELKRAMINAIRDPGIKVKGSSELDEFYEDYRASGISTIPYLFITQYGGGKDSQIMESGLNVVEWMKTGFQVSQEFGIERKELTDDEIRKFKQLQELGRGYLYRVQNVEQSLALTKGIASSHGLDMNSEIDALTGCLAQYEKQLKFYDSGILLQGRVLIVPRHFDSALDSSPEPEHLLANIESLFDDAVRIKEQVTLKTVSTKYSEYLRAKIGAIETIRDGLVTAVDPTPLRTYADFLASASREGSALNILIDQNVLNQTQLNTQTQHVKLLPRALEHSHESTSLTSSWKESITNHGITGELDNLIDIMEIESDLWINAGNTGSLDKKALSSNIAIQSEILTGVDSVIRLSVATEIEIYENGLARPISKEFTVKKGDLITEEISIPANAEFVRMEIIQIRPSSSWIESGPSYEVRYPIINSDQISYVSEKLNPIIRKELCECQDYFGGGFNLKETPRIEIRFNELGGAVFWGLFGAGASDGTASLKVYFQDESRASTNIANVDNLNSLGNGISAILNSQLAEVTSLGAFYGIDVDVLEQ